ncbi:SPX domain-containing membrane protein Os04g0573000 [Durusdinium trenchii]|uniref:SPX domain-containing membrane protein Os04g0573000 n=1 Tax=Durusdinium trenchii TaxID=1381693 RepID=A0ABP0LIQ4_9DINO
MTTGTVVALGCLGMVEYSVVMPSLASLLEDLGASKLFYGAALGIFSLARVLCMPVIGSYSDRRDRERPMLEAFMASIAVAFVGNVLYALALGYRNKWMVLVGRALVGMGAANSSLSMSFITRITNKHNRTRAIAMMNGINLIGIIVGPATNILVQDVDFRIGDSVLIFNHLSNPGWLMALFLALLFLLMASFFEEPPHSAPTSDTMPACCVDDAREDLEAPLLQRQVEGGGPTRLAGRSWGRASAIWKMLRQEQLLVHFVMTFSVNFVLNSIETALPVITSQAYGWNAVENSIMYSAIGLLVAASLAVVVSLSHRFLDRNFIVFGHGAFLMLLSAACVGLRDARPPKVLFLGFVLTLVGCLPSIGAPNTSLFSKRVQEHPHTALRLKAQRTV